MLATELLFVYVYCLVDDAIKAGALLIPRRPGPAPACTDAELLTIALVRHLLGRRSENGFLKEIRRDWGYLFPHLPDQPEVNRRTRWLWGPSSRSAPPGRQPCPPTRSSRSIPPRCRSSTPPGSAAQTSGPPRQRPGRPVRPRRRTRRMVLRLPPGPPHRPGQAHRPRLVHRARRHRRAADRH